MWSFGNIVPIQLKSIPWGWKNALDEDGNLWVAEPLGEIDMPEICEYFRWDKYEITCPPREKFLRLGTTNFKSIFTTAARFLGYEKLLVDQPDLTDISRHFVWWNRQLLTHINVITYFVIGDDIAGNNGLMMSPDTWRKWVKPHTEQLINLGLTHGCQVIYHSDGDVSELLDDFVEMGITVLDTQPIGHMRDFLNKPEYENVEITFNDDPEGREKQCKM